MVVLCQRFLHHRVCENLLDSGLGIVKVAFNGADADIAAFLRYHLALLHGADAVLGIEHQHAGAVYILEAFQCGFAGVAGSGHQNHSGFARGSFGQRFYQQMGQNLGEPYP